MLLDKHNCTLYRICNLEYRYKKQLEEKQNLEMFKHSNNVIFCLWLKGIIIFPMAFSFEIIRNQGQFMVLKKLAIITLLPGWPFRCPSLMHTAWCLSHGRSCFQIWMTAQCLNDIKTDRNIIRNKCKAFKR